VPPLIGLAPPLLGLQPPCSIWLWWSLSFAPEQKP
jgi:hypothetical protein